MCSQVNQNRSEFIGESALRDQAAKALRLTAGVGPSEEIQTSLRSVRTAQFAVAGIEMDDTVHVQIAGYIQGIDIAISAQATAIGPEFKLLFEVTSPIRLGPYTAWLLPGARAESTVPGWHPSNWDSAVSTVAKALSGVPALLAEAVGTTVDIAEFWRTCEDRSGNSSRRSPLA
jgi:hypothetical protein